jgi:hypothetical protein
VTDFAEFIFLQMMKNTGAIRAKGYLRRAETAKGEIVRTVKHEVKAEAKMGLEQRLVAWSRVEHSLVAILET